MCSVPTPVDAAAADTVDSSPPVSFCKDGRKITVGDCALFQAGNSPPFIGIIRSVTSEKEDCPKLEVNWLYRPADVKLSKGISIEAAPNEVFYSFHKDEISAASLLHPCKVAFLRKGVELSSGISSFICRRVYDIQNRCLWWLTDRDYINERQEEVDQLLNKTQLEMHAAVQSGARSPKPLNGPTSTQQLKSSSDSVQNSTTSFPSQGKSRKRERSDQGLEPIKREHSARADDGDSTHYKLASMIKSEIAKITDKGALVNSEGVDELVHLIHLDRADKKIDLAGRILLADVIAVTDKHDCLDRFVQLRGVQVLDDWLQEAHKGKVGDGNIPKENDKSLEEFLLVLLRALDKLPVNLHALQTSNVGKSVNNLRSHKNLEIQKKARSLVDMWKKRVDLEMKMNDAKSASSQSASWPGKPGFSEVPHGGNRRPASSEVAMKSTQPPASKMGSIKVNQLDTVAKSTSSSPGSTKLMPSSPVPLTTGSKDSHCKAAGTSTTSDMPLMTIREEKSSSSSQSQNNSQSCSSDHAKNSCKEDARSSTAGSKSAKTSSGASRTRRSSNGFLGSGAAGAQKESLLGKHGYLNRNTMPDKSLESGPVCERSADMPAVDHGNSHRLIVRLPNPGRSPAWSASGGSFEDPSVISRASSPGFSDRQDHMDRKAKGKGETCQATTAAVVNTESWKNSDVKNALAESDEVDRSQSSVFNELISNAVEKVKLMDLSKATCSSPGNEKNALPKSGKSFEDSFSINAFIESCARYCEASTSLSNGDDIGMNLLASVATGEMPKSEPASPSGSPETNSPERKDTSIGNSAKSRSFHDDEAQGHEQLDDDAVSDSEKQGRISKHESDNTLGENKSMPPILEHKLSSKHSEEFHSSIVELNQTDALSVKSDCDPGGTATDSGDVSTCLIANRIPPQNLKEDLRKAEGTKQSCEERARSIGGEDIDGTIDVKPKTINGSVEDNTTVDFASEKVAKCGIAASDIIHGSLSSQCDSDQVTDSCLRVKKEAAEESPSRLMDGVKMDMDHQISSSGLAMMKELRPDVGGVDALDRGGGEDAVPPTDAIRFSDNAIESIPEKADCMDIKSKLDPIDIELIEQTTTENNHAIDNIEENSEREDVTENVPNRSPHEESPTVPAQETDRCMKSAGSNLSGVEADGNHDTEECISAPRASSLSNATGSDMVAKLDFDLNEGFPVDEGNPSDSVISTAPGCSSAVHSPSPMPVLVSPLHSVLSVPITVAAALKRPFLHPESPLRNKGEIGWKGSAATSAFRPAEPRKVLEMPLITTDVSAPDAATGKKSRPTLDIDLNIPDERVLADTTSQSSFQVSGSGSGAAITNHDLGCTGMAFSSVTVNSTGGLDLDLNRADENTENGLPSTTNRRIQVSLLPVRSASGVSPNAEVNILRDFDLNNGPGLDDMGSDSVPRNQLAKSSGPFPSPLSGLRMYSPELGSISSWFPPGTTYPDIALPSFLPDRGDQPFPLLATAGPQRMMGSASGGTFGGDLYGAPVLSSPMAFSHAAPFPHAGFPFGNSFSLASTSISGGPTTLMDSLSGGGPCFPAVPSHLVGPAGAVSSHYSRPYVMSLPEGTPSSGGDSSWKWGRQCLDLNAGPGSTDVVGRDERLTSAPVQLSVVNAQGLLDEQARIYQSTSGPLKRKEPEGRWDADRFTFKQPSWQ